jgi:hypothetical protein
MQRPRVIVHPGAWEIQMNASVSDYCLNCKLSTALRLDAERLVLPVHSNSLTPPRKPYAREQVWTCLHCEATTGVLFIYEEGEDQGRAPAAIRVLWPDQPPRELPPEVPVLIQSLFREGSICEASDALRGAAGLYRACVEALVAEQGVSGSDLKQRINGLRAKGVDQETVDDLHEARLIGNWSLHSGVEFAPEEVADVADLIAEACHALYVEPARRAAMRAARAARRQP